MAIVKVPARDFKLEIDEGYGTSGGESFLVIHGMTSLAPGQSLVRTPTTDFDDKGIATHLPMERGRTLNFQGFHLEDPVTGVRDPGQAAVEALANRFGPDGLGRFRHTSPAGNVDIFFASADVTPGGGGNNDAAAWSGSLEISGAVASTPKTP